MDVHNIYRNDLYYDDNSYSIFTRYGEASTQADGRPDDSLSNNSLTQVKKICYCFTPKIAITTVLLVTLCFLGMNLYILFDNTFNPNSIENDVIVNVPIFSLKYNLKISYNHLRIAFSFINSFFLSLCLVFTFSGYFTSSPGLFTFQQVYILLELFVYMTLSIFIIICYILRRNELDFVLRELQHFFGFCFLFTMGPRIIISVWIYYILNSDIFDNTMYYLSSFN